MEGRGVYYYAAFPKNPMNDWLVAEHQKRFNSPPDFFTAGGFAAASAALTAIDKAGGTDTEKLIAAMEGMTFETPKGPMTFRKEDHQALQVMYHFKVKANGKDENDLLELVDTIPATGCRSRCATSVDPQSRRAFGPPVMGATLTHPTLSSEPALETRGLTVRFGGHVAVNDVSCAFHPGTLTAIVGPNGAGKTTYFNLVSGQLRASAGTVLVESEDITRLPASAPHPPRPRARVPAHQPVPAAYRVGKRALGNPEPRRGGLVAVSHLGVPPRPD
jgi:ABC-type glutathione transport system ATPase component